MVILNKGWLISKNKVFEIQFEVGNNNICTEYFCVSFKNTITEETDHPGVRFDITLLKAVFFGLYYYDRRHWDMIVADNNNSKTQ
jgi:hypothetical protein